MKLMYFDQTAADRDDKTLRDMIAAGKVPATCLLGGSVVEESVKAGVDPCEACPCPKRDVCGGRERSVMAEFEEYATVDSARAVMNDASSARRTLRKSINNRFREMISAAIKERSS